MFLLCKYRYIVLPWNKKIQSLFVCRHWIFECWVIGILFIAQNKDLYSKTCNLNPCLKQYKNNAVNIFLAGYGT